MHPLRTLRLLVPSIIAASWLTSPARLDAQTLVTAEMNEGLDWLAATRNPDGSWGSADEDARTFRATAAALDSLRTFRPGAADALPGLLRMERVRPETTEAIATMGIATALAGDPGQPLTFNFDDFVEMLLPRRNEATHTSGEPNYPEGGWGLVPYAGTNVLDTLSALKLLHVSPSHGPGLLINGQAIATGEIQRFSFPLPDDTTEIRLTITGATAGIQVRISGVEPPTNATPFFTIGGTPAAIPTDVLGGGENYLRIDGLANGVYGLELTYQTSSFDSESWSEAFHYLVEAQNPDGGWGLQAGSDSSVFVTATVLACLDDLRGVIRDPAPAANGTAWLISRQNPDGGFGEPVSEVRTTALAYQALTRLNTTAPSSINALAHLISRQDPDGSWGGDPTDTAAAIAGLRFSLRANDSDSDGTPDIFDNCPATANPDQSDRDRDGIGDACDPDDDNDGLEDIFESGASGTDPGLPDSLSLGVLDSEFDSDLDGRSNLQEQAAGSDPFQPDITLTRGLNLFTYPVEAAAGFSAFDLLATLGGPSKVERIEKFDPIGGSYQQAGFTGTTPGGTDFPIAGGDGLFVHMAAPHQLSFPGSISYTVPALHAGQNLVRFPDLLPADTSGSLIVRLSESSGDVRSIQRLIPGQSRFETHSTYRKFLVGPSFPVRGSETYLVHMNSVLPALAVTSHFNGQTVSSGPITVAGTVSSNIAFVEIEGIRVTPVGGAFTVPGVPLSAGANEIDVLAWASEDNYSSLTLIINVGTAPDHTIAAGGSDTGSRTITGPEEQLDQATSYSASFIGVPPGITYSTSSFNKTADDAFTVGYTLQVAPGTPSGTYSFSVTYQIKDSLGATLGPLTGNVFSLTVQVP